MENERLNQAQSVFCLLSAHPFTPFFLQHDRTYVFLSPVILGVSVPAKIWTFADANFCFQDFSHKRICCILLPPSPPPTKGHDNHIWIHGTPTYVTLVRNKPPGASLPACLLPWMGLSVTDRAPSRLKACSHTPPSLPSCASCVCYVR